MKFIELNESEKQIVQEIAKNRYKNNRESHIRNQRIGNQSDFETDLDGFGAEVAVAKAFNVYPDFSISPRSGGVDLIFTSGCTVDVKQTKYKTGMLLAPLKKGENDNTADIFILVTGTFPKYKIIGWCEKEKIINQNSIVNKGYGDTYGLYQKDLRSLAEL